MLANKKLELMGQTVLINTVSMWLFKDWAAGNKQVVSSLHLKIRMYGYKMNFLMHLLYTPTCLSIHTCLHTHWYEFFSSSFYFILMCYWCV